MSEYPWNEKNITFTWLSSLYSTFKSKIFTYSNKPFKRQPHKMVKHTQTIRQQFANMFDHFVEFSLKGLNCNCNLI